MAASKHKRKGQASKKFVMLHRWMAECAAYRSLSTDARAALIEFGLVYDGHNNGYIGMAVRRLGDRLNVGRNVAQRAMKELEDKGFIQCTELSSFNRKARVAREWRLTEHACDRTNEPPSKDFMRWRPDGKNHSPTSVTDSPASVTESCQKPQKKPSQSHQRDCQHQKRPPHSPTSVTHIDIPPEGGTFVLDGWGEVEEITHG